MKPDPLEACFVALSLALGEREMNGDEVSHPGLRQLLDRGPEALASCTDEVRREFEQATRILPKDRVTAESALDQVRRRLRLRRIDEQLTRTARSAQLVESEDELSRLAQDRMKLLELRRRVLSGDA